MLDQNDFKQIGLIIESKLENTKKELMIGMGELLEQSVLPQIDEVSKGLSEVRKVLTTLPTKDFLTEKLADARGDLVTMVRKEDKKVDFVVKRLHERAVLTDDDARHIQQEFQIFPTSSV